jgi:hypothetical protein
MNRTLSRFAQQFAGFSGRLTLLLILLAAWQAAAAELWNDEAYYWVFSLHPDWGYLDHPPMVAVWIKLGTSLFGNTPWGVRFVPLCAYLSSFFLLLYWSESKPGIDKVMLWSSVVALSLAGMLAVPDAPLLFFTLLFFITLRKFLQQPALRSSVLLSFCIAGLLYSKYHGILPVISALIFFPRLFKSKWLFVTTGFSLLLFLPHIIWQYTHGFPSMAYHLYERSQGTYRWNFTAEYLLNQVLLFGPFVSGILFASVWQARKSEEEYSRYLAFVFVFVMVFFLASSFKGNVEANWTAIALYPALYLSFRALDEKPVWKKNLKWFFVPSLLVLLAGKCFFLYTGAAGWVKSRNEWHGSKEWAGVLKKRAAGLPVVFHNSYQMASRYMFYAEMPAMSLNTPGGRRNQFEFWPYEDAFRNREVLLVTGSRGPDCDSVYSAFSGWVHVKQVKHFSSFMNLRCEMQEMPDGLMHGMPAAFHVHIKDPERGIWPEQKDKVHPAFRITSHEALVAAFTDTSVCVTQNHRDFTFRVQLPALSGKYYVQFTLQPEDGIATINSSIFPMKVK